MTYIIYLTINEKKEEIFQKTGNMLYETTKYIGSTTLNNDRYFGSSKWLIDDISKWSIDSFKRTTLFILLNNDPVLLLEYEKEIQLNYNVVNSTRFYNKALATEKFTPSNFIWYHNPTTNEKGKFHKTISPPHGWINGSGYSSITNKKAYYHITSKQVRFFNETPDDMWILGLPKGNTTGKVWYHNPANPSKRGCYEKEKKPYGWIKGMGDTSNHARKNNTWVSYYNPITMKEKHFIEGKEQNGWIRGSLQKTRQGQHWFHNPNNPSERGFFFIDDEIPPGWIKGKGYKSGGRPKGSKNKPKTMTQ